MGLLDGIDFADPQQMGLLGMAGGLLSAGGPSLMPHSFGQALGAGLQGMQTNAQLAIKTRQENLASQMQMAQLAQALRQGQITQAVYERALAQMNGAQPPAQQTQPQRSVPYSPDVGGMGSAEAPVSSTAGFTPPSAPSNTVGAPAGVAQGASTGGAFGMSPDAVMGGLMAGPQKFGEAIMAANATPEELKIAQRLGIPLEQVRAAKVAEMDAKGITSVRPGGTLFKNGAAIFSAPTTEGQYTTWDGGVPKSNLVSGAADVTQALARARAAGPASVKPITAYDSKGNPVFTNELDAATGGGGGTSAQIPWTGQGPPPANIDQIRAALGDGSGNGRLSPAPRPGYIASQEGMAKANTDRYNAMISQAAESPTRVNVYDNILNLSKEGVQSGPGEAWKNKVKGYAANTPLLGSVTGNWKNDVTGFQELNKFMYQNAQRNWQAAGGTGTDSQLEAFTKANPNDAMFPAALQKMAEWGKAGELALQGKANAMQQWKDANGGNVANQDQFERTWRNNFDPVLFQLKTMDPATASAYVANLKRTNPNGYATLMMKAQALKNSGGL